MHLKGNFTNRRAGSLQIFINAKKTQSTTSRNITNYILKTKMNSTNYVFGSTDDVQEGFFLTLDIIFINW